MITLKWSSLLIASSIFFVKNPYSLGALLGLILLRASVYSTWCSIFIRFILFLIYIGGLIILIIYCLILIPSRLYKVNSIYLVFILGALIGTTTVLTPHNPIELFRKVNLITIFGILLYLVILSVVETIDYSKGIIL